MPLPEQPIRPLSPEAQLAGSQLLGIINEDTSTEVLCNGPQDILVKQEGARYAVAIEFASAEEYHQVLNEYVLRYVDTPLTIDGSNIVIEGQLELPSSTPDVPPMLARVHMLCPPLVKHAKVTIAKKARTELTLDAMVASKSMTQAMANALTAFGYGRLTHVISGVSGAGKTTLAQALTHTFDTNDRIVVVEDTPELRLPLGDCVYLPATPPRPGLRPEDEISVEFLVKAANRMRMNRVVVGELRGAEAAEFLVAANSGAEGSLTTIHADSPRRALDKLLSLATKSPTAASEQTLVREIAQSVDIVVQASIIDGRHVVTAIEEITRTVNQSGLITSQPLFTYDRATGQHRAAGRPSDDLLNTLAQRGVTVDMSWFR